MKAIILASGSGSRFEPLSINDPKPLFTFLGKSIIEHNLDNLIGIVDEVIIVIGYLGDNIKNRIGTYYKGLKINYIWDKQIIGTGNSAKLAIKNIDEGKFILLNGDDIYSRSDMEKVLNNFPCMLAKKVGEASNFGVLDVKDGKVVGIEEKPKKPKSNLINTGLYYLPKKIFDSSIEKSERGEYEFTDYIKFFIKENELTCVEADNWSPASYPWDLFECVKIIFRTFNFTQKGVIEPNVTLKGRINIGENTLIKSGVYIEGPVYIGKNCIIGPNACIREGTVIEDNVSIGQGVEIKNSVVGTRTKINHLSYVGDSIIGNDCNFGAGTIVTNLRHDNKNIQTQVKGKLIDTGRRKLGVIMGNFVKTGANTIFYPGRKIWPNNFTKPGEQVTKDIS